MEERKTIFDYLGHVLCIFGFMMIIMMVFCKAVGENAKGLSSMFQLGGQGLAFTTMLQFLVVAVLIEGVRILFFTDILIKKLSILFRCIGMLTTILIIIVIFIVIFEWFPIHMWQPWLMFLLCFGICFGISTIVMNVKEKMENKRMEEGLARLKRQWKEDSNEK